MRNCWGSQNAPRLFFFDLDIWKTALKLKAQLQNSCRSQKAYVEALGIALAHELTRMNEDTPLLASDARGGLPHCEARRSSTGLPGGCAPCQPLAGGAGAGRTVPIRWGNRPAFLWIAGRFGVLRFRLMVKRGPRTRPQASEGEAQQGLFCGTRRIGQGDERLHCG